MKTKQRKITKFRLLGGPLDGELAWQPPGEIFKPARTLAGLVSTDYEPRIGFGRFLGHTYVGVLMSHYLYRGSVPHNYCVWGRAPKEMFLEDRDGQLQQVKFPEITFR